MPSLLWQAKSTFNLDLRAKVLTLLCILFISNRSYTPSDPLTAKSALDTTIYLAIAEAAPGLPNPNTNAVYHGAQRFFLPYAAGLIAKLLHTEAFNVFYGLIIFFGLMTALLLVSICSQLKTPQPISLVLITAALFNPYGLRLELAFCGFVNDACFVMGLAMLCLSLLKQNRALLLLAVCIMMSSKQTTLMSLPVILAWVNLHKDWQQYSLFWRLKLSFLCLLLPLVIYYCSSALAAKFSIPSVNIDMALGSIKWFLQGFKLSEALDFIGRALAAYLFPLLLLIALLSYQQLGSRRSLLPWLALSLSIATQPILSGPVITEGSGQRLFTLAVIPLLVGIATAWPKKLSLSQGALATSILAILLASMHHLFSLLGPAPMLREAFIALYALCGLAFYLSLRKGLGLSTLSQEHEVFNT